MTRVRQLVGAGVDFFRLNFAHGTHPEHGVWIRRVREAAKRSGRTVGVLVDLAGPKIRVRGLPHGRLQLTPGQAVALVRSEDPAAGDIPVNEPSLLRDLRPNQPVYLADGSFELRVVSRTRGRVDCRVMRGGLLLDGKGVNVPRTQLRLPSMTTKDRKDLRWAVGQKVDAVALSFVRRPQDLTPVRSILGDSGIPLISKIEKVQAIERLDAILAASDGVMVARGDLGVEASLVEVPMLQKRIIALANAHAKPVITATQMLQSMVDNATPTRAEATDVANAILDGTDAVMLSEETAMGNHPVEAVRTMGRIAVRAEEALVAFGHDVQAPEAAISRAAQAVSNAAVELAEAVGAVAIVTPTRSGATARHVARLRPKIPILALSRDKAVLQFLGLSSGVIAGHSTQKRRLGQLIGQAASNLRERGLAKPGDAFILTSGYGQSAVDTNLVTVQTLGVPPPGKR